MYQTEIGFVYLVHVFVYCYAFTNASPVPIMQNRSVDHVNLICKVKKKNNNTKREKGFDSTN